MPDYVECANCGEVINLDLLDTWADEAREIPMCGDDCAAAYDARQTETAGLIPAAPQSQGEQTHGK